MDDVSEFQKITSEIDKKFIFVTVSGAHLYGFDSFNSDLDLRGVHIPDVAESLRYSTKKDTFEAMWDSHAVFSNEIDIVSHSLLKFLHLLTKSPNGYLLEQVFSPLIVNTTQMHNKLKELAKLCITKELKHHFNGFYKNQERIMRGDKKQIKLALYQARIIAVSAYIASTSTINSNLLEVNNELNIFDNQKLLELVQLKKQGEKNNFPDDSIKKYWVDELQTKFDLISSSFDNSNLPNFDRVGLVEKVKKFIENHLLLKYL